MYDIEELIQLSALQHMAFNPRQCALIHVEQTWAESGRTAEDNPETALRKELPDANSW